MMSKNFLALFVFFLVLTAGIYAQDITFSNLEHGKAGVSEVQDAGITLSVDLSSTLRPVTHCANGSLYGITETFPSDIKALVAPLNPNVFVQPPRGGYGNQHPFGAAIPVSERLASTSAQVMIYLADLLPGWPYQWPGQASWLSQVTSLINDKKASGRSNYYGYSIWNERHGTWSSSNGDYYTVCWKPTYDLIRSLDPNAAIIGPQDSYYTSARMTEFLSWCKGNNCLPDIIAWHELLGSANISNNIKSYRNVESNLYISALPIAISEYCHPTHDYEGCPGTSAPFIAKFERNMVHSASISWWFTNLPGRLGSLLTAGNEKGGGWWFYKWYGDMTGNIVSVTPPNENSDGIDGFACLDTNAKYASICQGGNYTGTMNVVINGIPSAFGDSVNVKVEYVSWSNKDTPVSGPTTVSTTNYTVSKGAITVPVNVTSPLYGYRVYITPIGSLVEVGATQQTIPSDFALKQNYPNPFNPTTQISFDIPEKSFISLKVYNVIGEEILELVGRELAAGKHNIKFDASSLASGIYMYRLSVIGGKRNFTDTKKMMLLK
jgi:hypothetical protein